MAQPMLGEVELQLVQNILVDENQILNLHSIPALEGDFFQKLGRRISRITLTGVITGTESGEGLRTLREKFRAAEPVSFVADIATATKLDRVVIEAMDVRELAGKPERFEYALTLREFIAPPTDRSITEQSNSQPENQTDSQAIDAEIAQEATELQEQAVTQIEAELGTIEITVELNDLTIDLSQVQIQVQGESEDGQTITFLLSNPENGVFRKMDVPVGQYTATLVIPE
jgi:hypothetical protein